MTGFCPKGLGDNPFIRMVSNRSHCFIIPPSLPPLPSLHSETHPFFAFHISFCLYNSRNKSLDENAGRAHARSPSSAGTRARACVSSRRWSARPAQRRATCARRASSISSTTSRRRSATPRSAPRTTHPLATSTGSTTPRIRRPRCAQPPLPREKKKLT
jgi:hypothetical protein